MSVVGYPTPGKEKAKVLLDAFCLPAGGSVVNKIPDQLLPGAAAFYGVTPATKHLWLQARKENRDWYYIDNAYFDSCRERYFRVTRNRLQVSGNRISDGARFAALGIELAPWREPAPEQHVLVCPQSDEFMRVCAEYPGSWLEDTLRALERSSTRVVRVRAWNRNKKAWYASLPEDLKNCHALVTYSSASATTAMIHGVPAFALSADCVSRPASGHYATQIEKPVQVDRLPYMQVAADNQFTIEEMRKGLAWRHVSKSS